MRQLKDLWGGVGTLSPSNDFESELTLTICQDDYRDEKLGMNDKFLSNEDWYKVQISLANSDERLEFLKDIIKFDLDDGEDLGDIKELRELWTKRKQELSND